jgi:hypothetical protein
MSAFDSMHPFRGEDTSGDALSGLESLPRHGHGNDIEMKAALSTTTAELQQTSMEANNDSYIAGDPVVEATSVNPALTR